MRNKSYQKILILLWTTLLCFAFANTVYAADPVIDFDKTGSISIEFSDLATKKTKLEGIEFTLYQVASLNTTTAVSYVHTAAFSGCAANVNPQTAADSSASARALASYAAQNNLTGIKSRTGSDGIAAYANLDLGMYLAVQTSDIDQYFCDPFLIALPMTGQTGTGWVYDVTAHPKGETAPPLPSPSPPQTPPKTGDEADILLYIILLIVAAGIVFACLFFLLWRKNKR